MLIRYENYGVDIFVDILPFNPEKIKYFHGKFRGKFALVFLDSHNKLQKINVNLSKFSSADLSNIYWVSNASMADFKSIDQNLNKLRMCMSRVATPEIMEQSIKSGIWLAYKIVPGFADYWSEMLMSMDWDENEEIKSLL